MGLLYSHMRIDRTILVVTLASVATVLMFPFRIGTAGAGEYEKVAEMGPTFVFSQPSVLEICAACHNKSSNYVGNPSVVHSRIDYGRTGLVAGAVLLVGLIARTLLLSAKGPSAGQPLASSGPEREYFLPEQNRKQAVFEIDPKEFRDLTQLLAPKKQ